MDHSIDMNGSGEVEAYDLHTNNTSIILNGSGESYVYVKNELDVVINGSGDVCYKGNGTLTNSIIEGSGDVHRR